MAKTFFLNLVEKKWPLKFSIHEDFMEFLKNNQHEWNIIGPQEIEIKKIQKKLGHNQHFARAIWKCCDVTRLKSPKS